MIIPWNVNSMQRSCLIQCIQAVLAPYTATGISNEKEDLCRQWKPPLTKTTLHWMWRLQAGMHYFVQLQKWGRQCLRRKRCGKCGSCWCLITHNRRITMRMRLGRCITTATLPHHNYSSLFSSTAQPAYSTDTLPSLWALCKSHFSFPVQSEGLGFRFAASQSAPFVYGTAQTSECQPSAKTQAAGDHLRHSTNIWVPAICKDTSSRGPSTAQH